MTFSSSESKKICNATIAEIQKLCRSKATPTEILDEIKSILFFSDFVLSKTTKPKKNRKRKLKESSEELSEEKESVKSS